MLVGALFLTSTAAWWLGSSLITSHSSGDSPGNSTLVSGVVLEMYAGLAVVGIGVAMLPLLSRHSVRLARAYLGLRSLECLTTVLASASMLATMSELKHYELVVYSFTGLGGVVFSYALYRSRFVPRRLAALGMLGYPVLLAGVPAAVIGLTDLNAGWEPSSSCPADCSS